MGLFCKPRVSVVQFYGHSFLILNRVSSSPYLFHIMLSKNRLLKTHSCYDCCLHFFMNKSILTFNSFNKFVFWLSSLIFMSNSVCKVFSLHALYFEFATWIWLKWLQVTHINIEIWTGYLSSSTRYDLSYFILQIYLVPFLAEHCDQTVCVLVISRTRFRMNPHSIVARMSRNSLLEGLEPRTI